MQEIFSSETFMPASTQSGVGIGEANSDAMFREQADESNTFATTISSGSPIPATSLLGMGASTSVQNVGISWWFGMLQRACRPDSDRARRSAYNQLPVDGRQSGGKRRCVAHDGVTSAPEDCGEIQTRSQNFGHENIATKLTSCGRLLPQPRMAMRHQVLPAGLEAARPLVSMPANSRAIYG